jgi:F-type H+-transporting ATPase subunit b
MPQFDFSTYSSQIFWFSIFFALIYFFSSKIILPRIAKILHERKSIIDTDIAFASRLDIEINEIQAQNDALVSKANQEYQNKLSEVSKEAARKKEKMIEELKNNIDQKIEKSRNEIKGFLVTAKNSSSNAIDDIAGLIKQKILN